MSALPILADSPAAFEERFRDRLRELETRHLELWRRTPDDPPCLGEKVSFARRVSNGRAARRLVDRLAHEVESHPEEPEARKEWRGRIEAELRAFGERRLGWPAGYRRLLFADAYFDASVAFTRRARAFDPGLSAEEIGQAIRNVWIMNSLQMLLELPVELSPAIFAYSMLYPETDNYLDDATVPLVEKRRFNEELRRRLGGERLSGRDRHQDRVFLLVEAIEGQWPRLSHPGVWESLLAIHRGQVRSLEQDGPGPTPGGPRLLALSAAKGGASVLADGYLTAGRLAPAEAEFCFGYGFFLQLLDDLQDLEIDRRNEHATLFSTCAAGPDADRLAARLYHFMRRVVAESPRFSARRFRDHRDLILRNCTLLLVGAVAEHRHFFTRRFLRRLEGRWPLRFAAMRRLRRRARSRFEGAFAGLRKRHGVDSALDLL